jgi:uncharacterized membrane protein YfcA
VAFVLALAVPTGVLIGAIGIGGVLLPPALIWLGGLDPHEAAGTSTFAFLFTGLVGTIAYARRGAMPWRFAGFLTAGAAPFAALGALVNGIAPALLLHVALALVTLGSGVFNLISHPASVRLDLPPFAAISIGAVVGFGSALTGTGGPVLLVPALLALGVEPLTTVAAGQLISLPLVAFGSVGFASSHLVHYRLAIPLGVLAACGVVAGAALAHRLPRHRLRRVASIALLAVGGFLLVMTPLA